MTLLSGEFIDSLTGANKLQIKVWTTSDSILYNLSISTLVGKLTFLRWFYWLPNRCNRITNQGVNYLHESLKGLQSLYLNFERLMIAFVYFWLGNSCDQITDQVLSNLGENLKQFNSLHSIHLDFTGQVIFVRWIYWFPNRCQQITDQGLHYLSQSLKSSLQSINLQFIRFVNFVS